MATLKVRQVELDDHGRRMVVWVDAALRLQPGFRVIGKDGAEWHVVKVYTQALEPHLLNRGWSVGGLF